MQPWTWWRPEIYCWMNNAADHSTHFKCKIWNGKPWKIRENKKHTKKSIFQKSCGSAPSPKSLEILFFFCFFGFLEVFLVFSNNPSPRVLKYCLFFCFLDAFLIFSKGPSPKSLKISFFFSMFFLIFSKGPFPKSLEILFFLVFLLFLVFSRSFLVFSKGPSPKSLQILFFLFFLFPRRPPPKESLNIVFFLIYCFFGYSPLRFSDLGDKGWGKMSRVSIFFFFEFFHGFLMVLELLYVGASYSRLYGV